MVIGDPLYGPIRINDDEYFLIKETSTQGDPQIGYYQKLAANSFEEGFASYQPISRDTLYELLRRNKKRDLVSSLERLEQRYLKKPHESEETSHSDTSYGSLESTIMNYTFEPPK